MVWTTDRRKHEGRKPGTKSSALDVGIDQKQSCPSFNSGPSFNIYYVAEDTKGGICDSSALSTLLLSDNEE